MTVGGATNGRLRHKRRFILRASPPIESLRTVLSQAMTRIEGLWEPDWRPESATRTQISFIDTSRAYFNATIDQDNRLTFVDVPKEDADYVEMCGQPLRHMHGTRPAADGWQD